MLDALDWIMRPNDQVDSRGPLDRDFVPFGDTAASPSILERLHTTAARRPDAIAVRQGDETLTYAALLRAVAHMHAEILRAQPAFGHIGILLPSNAAYAAAVFASLAAGRTCVLLDASYPDARNRQIAEQTGINLLIAERDEIGNWPVVATLAAPDVFGISGNQPELPDGAADLDAPAFILCTSGSSGQPKPIVYSQRTLLHWLRIGHDIPRATPSDRALSLSSFATLGGITAIGFVLSGASLQIVDMKSIGFGGLIATLMKEPVTMLRAVPSMLRHLAQLPDGRAALAGLRLVLTYGEPLMKRDVAELRSILPDGCFIRSNYGSTEASGVGWFAGEPDDHDPLRVATGVLLPDTMAAIVDDDGRSCAVGEPGELFIRSRYNAIGEWIDGRPVSGRLEPHPSGDGTTVYRTGDIACYHTDGVFVVLGRKDRMLKINGQRIEPAEIEAALRRVAGVTQAEVLVQPHATSPRLLAFVVGTDTSGEFARNVRAELRAMLPEFMVPSRIIPVAAIPLLPGGKTDAPALFRMADAR